MPIHIPSLIIGFTAGVCTWLLAGLTIILIAWLRCRRHKPETITYNYQTGQWEPQ